MIKTTYKPAYLKAMLLMSVLSTELLCAENTESYYGKSLYKLRTEDSKLDAILKKAWWDYYFFNIKSFFDAPSHNKIARMKQRILFLRAKMNNISACMDKTYKEYKAIKDPECLGDGNNPGLAVAANILFFPFMLLESGMKARERERLRNDLITMEKAKDELRYWADELQSLVNDSCLS